MKKIYRGEHRVWTIERAVFAFAGILVCVTAILGLFVQNWWHYVTIFVGGMLLFFAITGYCPFAMILASCGMRDAHSEKIHREA